jgi:hypothetical protein
MFLTISAFLRPELFEDLPARQVTGETGPKMPQGKNCETDGGLFQNGSVW